jgi:dTMP kinase
MLASIEGISGSGKTYLVEKLAKLMRETPTVFLSELSERRNGRLDYGIIQALQLTGDRFFRSGEPRAVTFLLLALKIWDYEALVAPTLRNGGIVVEDRSIHTIAVYQAILLNPVTPELRLATVNELLTLARNWRALPDVTFLVELDFDTALERAERRNSAPYTAEERALLADAAALYSQMADQHPEQFVRCDRRKLSDDAILITMKERLLRGLDSQQIRE